MLSLMIKKIFQNKTGIGREVKKSRINTNLRTSIMGKNTKGTPAG